MWQSDLLYAAQFAAMRAFVGRLDRDDLEAPSNLPGWTVADLVAHLGGTGRSIAALEDVPAGPALAAANASALTVAQYLGAYASAADDIAASARALAAEHGGDPRPALDETHRLAMARLAELGAVDRIVRARRGPILLSSFLDTRLLEVVVHTGDLRRSAPAHPPPRILASARRRVVVVLRDVLAERAADPPAALAAAAGYDEAVFLDLATGRAPLDGTDPALAQALPLL